MTFSSTELLQELKTQTENHLVFARSLLQLPDERISRRPKHDAWNAVECLEHLNLYFAFYLPEIEKRLLAFKGKPSDNFKSGWLGNYLAKSMLPKEKPSRMKTFRSMDPIHSNAGQENILKFIANCEKFLSLLEQSQHADLTKIKTAISISSFIKLRLGDTLRFLAYHNERHILQARKALG